MDLTPVATAATSPAPMAVRPPLFVIAPRAPGWQLRFGEVWAYRELLLFLIWRDLRIRYRQTALGIVWAVLQPLIAMAIFSIVFGVLARMPSDGVPYPLFTFAALLPWTVCATSLARMTSSLVVNQNLVQRVYFPRVLAPLSGLGSAIVDFLFALLVLLGLMIVAGIMPSWRMLALPLLFAVGLLAAMGVGLWCAAFNVRYRDMVFVVPFLTQVWLYISPVGYSSQMVPVEWRWLYALNPMVGVVEGFRWALLGTPWMPALVMAISSIVAVLVAISGWLYFQRTEDTFADVL